ncbi:MAG: hypothetical protein V4629_09660 [Pseudomonadota bacterium]
MTQPIGPKRPASPSISATESHQSSKKQKSNIDGSGSSMSIPNNSSLNTLLRIEAVEIKAASWQETLKNWVEQTGLTNKEKKGRIEAKDRILQCFENSESDLHLEDLHLSYLPNIFADRLHLQCLNIKNNKRIEDVSVLNCSHLKRLEVSNCELNSLDELDLPATLISLIVSGNSGLKTINLSTTNLETLIVKGCALTELSKKNLPASLKYIRISDNENLENIQLCHIAYLEELEAQGCNLKALTEDNLPSSLIKIWVADNHALSNINLSHITDLKELDLESCGLTNLQKSHLPTKLETLDVSENQQLQIIDCSDLLNLKALFLNNCNLDNILFPNPELIGSDMLAIDPFKLQEICLSNNRRLDITDDQLQILVNHPIHHLELENTLVQWENLPQQLQENDEIFIDTRPENEANQNLLGAQNTHTASIHASSSANAALLLNNNTNLNIAESWSNFKKFVEALSIDNAGIHLDTGRANQAFKNSTAQRYMQYPSHLEHIDKKSSVSVQQFLALFWTAIHDEKQREKGVSKHDGEQAIINALYETQRGYNLNEQTDPQDDGEEDSPICAGGTFNKISEKQVSILKDMKFEFVNSKTFNDRIHHEIRVQAQQLLETADNKKTLIVEVQENEHYLTLNIWNQIKQNVCNRIQEAFDGKIIQGKNTEQMLEENTNFESTLQYLKVID